jgi:hypothetical protein
MYALAGAGLDPERASRIMAATCWSEQLNQDMIEECDAGGPGCAFNVVSSRLQLPYCPGECESKTSLFPQSSEASLIDDRYTGPILLGLAAAVGVVLLARRKRA